MIELQTADVELNSMLPSVKLKAGALYLPSQFALSIVHHGKAYVYHTLTKQCIEGKLPQTAGAGEGFDELIAARFLVPSDQDECAFYNSISSMIRNLHRKNGIQGYTILPTFACNARCVYCYEEGVKPVTMTPETVEQTIRYISETRDRDGISLSWFGGEPLLCPQIIDRICEGLREEGIVYRSSIITNGSLITPEIIQKMTGEWKLSNVQISMDGSEKEYIARKRYVLYRDYYHTVMEAIGAMSEKGIRVAVRCNVDEENWANMDEYLRDMKNGVTNKDNVSIYFAPLFHVRSGQNDRSMWEAVINARSAVKKAGFRTFMTLEPSRMLNVCHCMADGGSMVIAPDGSLYVCEHLTKEANFGDVWHGVTDEEAMQAFCRADRTREKCKKCLFLPECTSFASCPITEAHCREVRQMATEAAIKRMIDKKETESAEETAPLC